MAIHRFEPRRLGEPWASFDQLRREIDSLLGSWGAWGAETPQPRSPNVFPPVNLYESADSLVLMAEVPGVRSEDLDVSVQGNQVILRGQRSIGYPADASAHRRERQAGAFHRTVELPYAVDVDKVDATCRHGVLLLRLPKPGERQRRQISVRSS
jgi:HSP20 family protein